MRLSSVNLCGLFSLFFVGSSTGALVWTEDFSGYSPGASLDSLATTTGSGTLDTNGDVVADGGGAAVLTASATRAQLAVVSNAAAIAGNYSFDLQFITAGDTGSDLFFLQMVDGSTRSTGGSPVPNFSDTVDASVLGLNVTDTVPTAINYFFNVSAGAVPYMAPNGLVASLAAGTYDLWAGTSLSVSGQSSSNNGGGIPTGGVDSLVMQTFTQQAGEVFEFSEMSFQTIPVPEPSAFLLGLSGVLLVARRRR